MDAPWKERLTKRKNHEEESNISLTKMMIHHPSEFFANLKSILVPHHDHTTEEKEQEKIYHYRKILYTFRVDLTVGLLLKLIMKEELTDRDARMLLYYLFSLPTRPADHADHGDEDIDDGESEQVLFEPLIIVTIDDLMKKFALVEYHKRKRMMTETLVTKYQYSWYYNQLYHTWKNHLWDYNPVVQYLGYGHQDHDDPIAHAKYHGIVSVSTLNPHNTHTHTHTPPTHTHNTHTHNTTTVSSAAAVSSEETISWKKGRNKLEIIKANCNDMHCYREAVSYTCNPQNFLKFLLYEEGDVAITQEIVIQCIAENRDYMKKGILGCIASEKGFSNWFFHYIYTVRVLQDYL